VAAVPSAAPVPDVEFPNSEIRVTLTASTAGAEDLDAALDIERELGPWA